MEFKKYDKKYKYYHLPNTTVKWVAFLLHVQEVPYSDIDLKTNCHDWDCISNYATDCSLIILPFDSTQPEILTAMLQKTKVCNL
jgi:hypothetical protein